MPSDILDDIDTAAAALLKRASGESLSDGQKKPTLSEQVKAFEAAAKWAEVRHKIRPPEQKQPEKESKFDALKGKFHGRAARGGRIAAAGAPHLTAVPAAPPPDARPDTAGEPADGPAAAPAG
jgi:hypothetical protein